MDLSVTLKKYLEELSSNSATPGGGNVAALCGALAVSLGVMVCNLTIGKKKYAEVQEELIKIKKELEIFKEEFILLAKKDNEAFERVMDAYRLPKENNEEQALRKGAIEKATQGAALVPAEVIRKCLLIMPFLEQAARKGNKNSFSDAGVAISLISSSAEGAFFNVLINCSSLADRKAAKELIGETEEVYGRVKASTQNLISEIIQTMKNQ